MRRIFFLNEHGILPHCVPIPVRIEAKTATARLARAKADKYPAGKPIFPAIALSSNHTNNRISISVHQTFTVRARGSTSVSTNEFVVANVTEGDLLLSSYYRHWQADTDTDTDDNLNVKEETGRWVQHWTLQPTVPLDCFPPTFSSELVDCAVCRGIVCRVQRWLTATLGSTRCRCRCRLRA